MRRTPSRVAVAAAGPNWRRSPPVSAGQRSPLSRLPDGPAQQFDLQVRSAQGRFQLSDPLVRVRSHPPAADLRPGGLSFRFILLLPPPHQGGGQPVLAAELGEALLAPEQLPHYLQFEFPVKRTLAS